MTWEGVLQKNLSQSPWSSMIQLGFPWFSLVPYPFSHHFSHQKKRWPDPSAPAGADESPRSDPARGAPLPGPRESMGKNEEKNIKKKPEKLWKNLMKYDEMAMNWRNTEKHQWLVQHSCAFWNVEDFRRSLEIESQRLLESNFETLINYR